MTTIITRLMSDPTEAHRAADRLMFRGVPKRAIDVIVAGGDVAAQMTRAQVHESGVEKYQAGLSAGNAVIAVRTTYKPLGAAQLTRDILDKHNTIDVSGVDEDFFVPSTPDTSPSVLKDHPRFLTMPADLDDLAPRGTISDAFMPLLKSHRAKRSVMSPPRRVSRSFWPMALVTKKQRSSSVFSGGRYMSKMFWPMPLTTNKRRRLSVIRGGGFPFSRLFGWKTIS